MSDHQPDSQPDIAGSISNKDGASDNKPARQRKPKRPAYYSLFQLPNALVRKQPELYTLSTPPGTAPTKITYAPSDPFSRRLNRWKRSIERGGAFKNKRRLDHEVLGSRFRSERVGDVRTKGRVLLNGRLYLPTPRSALKFKLVARRFKGFVEHWLESAPERSLPLPTLSGSMLRGQDWVEPNRRMMVDGRASKNPAGYPKLRAQMAARKAAAAAAAAGEAAAGAEAGNSNGNQDDRHADTDADADNESSSQSETDEDSKPIADVNDTEAMPVEQKYPKYYRHHHLLWREDPFNEDTGRFEDGHPILNITFDQATAKHFDKPFVRHTESMNVASVRNALRSGRKTQQTEFAKSRFELPSSVCLDASRSKCLSMHCLLPNTAKVLIQIHRTCWMPFTMLPRISTLAQRRHT
ncbi:hypothetical protein BC831DRAFT_67576 [Entophlyctis helioformis]|nr:hypothetical protein BC831DRAFT_67576 [Entophlyctis helioformis]